jgi:chemotaxis protein methyltransferase CheR
MARSGLVFDEDRWPFLRNGAGQAMRRAGFTTTRRWLDQVGESAVRRGALYVNLEESLTVQETGFFRYETHYRVLRELVIPALVRTGGLRVRVLSVGCATGEEPYSIAMTLRESVPPPLVSAIEVLAFDVSRSALATAIAGRYPADRLTRVPPACRAKYFLAGSGGFTVAPALRQMVRFRQHDVRRGCQVGRCAVVFCCDVLPYFTPPMRRQVLGGLSDALAEGGYLFLGDADEALLDTPGFEPVDGAGGAVFRRRTAPTMTVLAGSATGG